MPLSGNFPLSYCFASHAACLPVACYFATIMLPATVMRLCCCNLTLQNSFILLCRSHASFLWSYCFATIMLLLPLSGCLATHAAALPMPYRFAGRAVGWSHSTLPQLCCSPLSACLILLCHSYAAHHCRLVSFYFAKVMLLTAVMLLSHHQTAERLSGNFTCLVLLCHCRTALLVMLPASFMLLCH